MTLQPKFVAAAMTLAAVLVIVAAAMIVAGAVENARLISATPETESTFFRTFAPDRVVKEFACESARSVGGTGAGAGMRDVTHEENFDQYFAIPSGDWVPVIKSLQDDISLRLLGSGAQILDQGGDVTGGFRVHYPDGQVCRSHPRRTIADDRSGHAQAAGRL